MTIEFDQTKNSINPLKHDISLARAADLEVVARIPDERFSEPRYRAYGFIDGKPYCLAYTLRGDNVRAISLRRAHREEIDQFSG